MLKKDQNGSFSPPTHSLRQSCFVNLTYFFHDILCLHTLLWQFIAFPPSSLQPLWILYFSTLKKNAFEIILSYEWRLSKIKVIWSHPRICAGMTGSLKSGVVWQVLVNISSIVIVTTYLKYWFVSYHTSPSKSSTPKYRDNILEVYNSERYSCGKVCFYYGTHANNGRGLKYYCFGHGFEFKKYSLDIYICLFLTS